MTDWTVDASLSGEADLGADLTGLVPVAAALFGRGNFVPSWAAEIPVAANLSGRANLVGDCMGAVPVAAALTGRANLVSSLHRDRGMGADLDGVGLFRALVTVAKAVQVPVSNVPVTQPVLRPPGPVIAVHNYGIPTRRQ